MRVTARLPWAVPLQPLLLLLLLLLLQVVQKRAQQRQQQLALARPLPLLQVQPVGGVKRWGRQRRSQRRKPGRPLPPRRCRRRWRALALGKKRWAKPG